jgi:hypothetical protein
MSESALKTRTVFLDTQAYDDNKLHFAGPSLKKIRDLGAGRFLKILTTEVVDREVRSHVRRALSSAVTSHERLKGYLAMLQALPSGAPSVLASELELAQLLPLGLKVWDDFLSGGRVEMVSVEQVGARQLMDLYFEQLPPFSEKKKSEFPDAISLLALEQWQRADGGELYLIGDDPDIKAWCESHPRMHHVPHLKEFVDLYNRAEQQLSGLAISLFEREEDWIVSVIRDAFVECTFSYAGDWDADVENVAIASTLIDNISVIEVDETRFVLTLDMEIRFSADISGASHDGPDMPQYYHMHPQTTEHYDVSFEATYDLATEQIRDLRDIRFDDETQITIPDAYC